MKIYKSETENGKRSWLVIGNREFRLNRVLFSLVMILATFSTIWPGYTLFASPTPLVLGLPLSLAWNILWVVITFFAMLALHFSDNKDPETD